PPTRRSSDLIVEQKDRDRSALDGFLNFRASFDGTVVCLALGQSLRVLGLTFGREAGHQGPDCHVDGLFGTFIIVSALGDLVQHLLGSGGELGLDDGSALDRSGQNDRIGGIVRDEPVDEVSDAARMILMISSTRRRIWLCEYAPRRGLLISSSLSPATWTPSFSLRSRSGVTLSSRTVAPSWPAMMRTTSNCRDSCRR